VPVFTLLISSGDESIASTAMEESLDFRDDRPKSVKLNQHTPAPSYPPPPIKPPRIPSTISMPDIEIRESGNRDSRYSDSGLYSPLVGPTSLAHTSQGTTHTSQSTSTQSSQSAGTQSTQSSRGGLEKYRVKNLYLEGNDSMEDSYQDPVELEALTMRRVPSDEVVSKLSKGARGVGEVNQEAGMMTGAAGVGLNHSGVVLRRKSGGVLPTPYIDPASLDRNGDFV